MNIPESLGALPVPKAKTGATDFEAPSETALSGEVKANELFAGATSLKKQGLKLKLIQTGLEYRTCLAFDWFVVCCGKLNNIRVSDEHLIVTS